MSDDQPDFLSVRRFAHRADRHPRTIRRWCRSGLLRSIVVNDRGERLIPTSELQRLLDLAAESADPPERDEGRVMSPAPGTTTHAPATEHEEVLP